MEEVSRGTLMGRPFARAAVWVALVACFAIAGAQAPDDHYSSLTAVLAVAAVASGFGVAEMSGRTSISGGFIVVTLAAAFQGPATTCAIAVLTEVSSAVRRRSNPDLVVTNLLSYVVPGLIVANGIRAVGLMEAAASRATFPLRFYAIVGVGGFVYLSLSLAAIVYFAALLRLRGSWDIRTVIDYTPALAINSGVAVIGAGLYLKNGVQGILFALAAVAAFAYMAQLLYRARERADQYAALSWGVLGGLLRALDQRNPRAARHAAAVARFAGDIAKVVGMSTEDCELAHTAGLLHDIGDFALSDRVAERGRALTDDDWEAIQRHPELGADMLKDLGTYGPVAEIVRAHHERVDGWGYPNRLTAEEIPEIAKIVAVAEVYDTLTASDTYRTPMSSFEALTELRRVAGTQLDERYVEALAGLLSGEGLGYRHADAADFDAELALERRRLGEATG
jgi:putative nucleotidyltransferase with HDIG domain